MLVKHLEINREFFAIPPKPREWREWVQDGLVDGKLIGNKIFINRNLFAANSLFVDSKSQTAIDILNQSQ